MPISKKKLLEVRNKLIKLTVFLIIITFALQGLFYYGIVVSALLWMLISLLYVLDFALIFGILTSYVLYYVIVPEQKDVVEEEETEVKPGIAMPYGPRAIYSLVLPDGSSIRIEGKMYNEFGRNDFQYKIPYAQAKLISKKHFAIKAVLDEEGKLRYYIKDLGSRNGTLLNGVDLRDKGWIELKDGDIISPASTVNLVFRVHE